MLESNTEAIRNQPLTRLNGNGLRGSPENATTVFVDHRRSNTLALTFGLGDMRRPELGSNGKKEEEAR